MGGALLGNRALASVIKDLKSLEEHRRIRNQNKDRRNKLNYVGNYRNLKEKKKKGNISEKKRDKENGISMRKKGNNQKNIERQIVMLERTNKMILWWITKKEIMEVEMKRKINDERKIEIKSEIKQ